MEQVTAAQAAMLTGFSERTIRRRIAAGALPARRIATNRFAIDVRDLPRRWDGHELERRLEALERRVQLLEEGQRILLRRLGHEAPQTTEAGDAPNASLAGEQDASVTMLHELLVQLARETERLAPLLAPEERQEEPRDRRLGGRQRGGARLRPLPGDAVARRCGCPAGVRR